MPEAVPRTALASFFRCLGNCQRLLDGSRNFAANSLTALFGGADNRFCLVIEENRFLCLDEFSP
jgi:hypothetical protein